MLRKIVVSKSSCLVFKVTEVARDAFQLITVCRDDCFPQLFITLVFKSDDDSPPEDGQSSSGDEELEPEADQLSSRGELKNNQALIHSVFRMLDSVFFPSSMDDFCHLLLFYYRVIYVLSLKGFSQSPGRIFGCQYLQLCRLEICRSALNNIIKLN